MGGRGSSSTGVEYSRLPVSVRMYGPARAPAEDRAEARKIITAFITNAKAGDVYKTGLGFGSSGNTFEVVEYRRSPNKMGIRSGGRTVAMTRDNVISFIGNGAKRVKKGK